jgi:UDP-glucose 4-epimerase
MRVAVIGATGFIGRHVVARLKQLPGVQVTSFGREASGEVLKFDPEDSESVKRHFGNQDVVYYLISGTIPATSWQQPLLELTMNLGPFIRFLETLAPMGNKRIAFVSSAGTIYGPTTEKVHEGSDKKPFSPYGIVKLAMENFLEYFHVRYGLGYDIYRVTNVYGPGQDITKGLGIINTFLEGIAGRGEVTLYGDGSATRNFVFVSDVAELLTFTLRTAAPSGVYNIASPETISIKNLIGVIREVVSEPFKVAEVDARQSDNSRIDVDGARLTSAFESFRYTDLRTGIARTYEAIKMNRTNDVKKGNRETTAE